MKYLLVIMVVVLGSAMPFSVSAKEESSGTAVVSQEKSVTTDEVQRENEKREWQAMVGVGVGYNSYFGRGAENKLLVFPVIRATYKRWAVDQKGLRFSVIDFQDFSAGVGVGYDFGRKEKELPEDVQGLGDVDGGGAARIFVRYNPIKNLTITTDVIAVNNDANSLLVSPGVSWHWPLLSEMVVGEIAAEAIWGNEDHMVAYYGVDDEQAARSGIAQFSASAGVESVRLSAGITIMTKSHWAWNIRAGVKQYQESAAESPMVEDEYQPFAMSSLSYVF